MFLQNKIASSLQPLRSQQRSFPGFIKLALLGALAAGMASASAFAQTANSATAPPVAYASVSELNGIVGQVKQVAASMDSDLGSMRIEKWKTDGGTKRQTQTNVDSIRRNVQSALPEILTQVSNSPEDLAASFKLYRNLDALYDVFGAVVESAGAFGSKDEFQSLSNDLTTLENARRSMGERMQKLASAKEDELARLRAQVKTLNAAPPAAPKKIVVDDNEPAAKKPAAKKKTTPAKKPTAPATQPATTNPSASQ